MESAHRVLSLSKHSHTTRSCLCNDVPELGGSRVMVVVTLEHEKREMLTTSLSILRSLDSDTAVHCSFETAFRYVYAFSTVFVFDKVLS